LKEQNCIILVVDDEREHADGIVEALEKLPAKAIAVYNGKDALEMMRHQRVDVVVTDLKLGGDFDGLMILEEAKKLDSRTEVILITAYATIDTCKESLRRGAYDYLVKPIDIDQLRTLVNQASRKASAAYLREIKAGKIDTGDFEFEGLEVNGEYSLTMKKKGYYQEEIKSLRTEDDIYLGKILLKEKR